MNVTSDDAVRSRARAYDAVYAHWHAKRVTIESFERWARFFLDTPTGEDGHLDGNEIACAMRLLGVDDLSGKRLLDYCCGTGRSSIYFALKGAEVCAFDASEEAIRIARDSAALSGVADRVRFDVMDGRDLQYPSALFDRVYCQSALHIVIDYPACPRELARVLKPGGRAVFCEEALGHNPLLELARRVRRRKYRDCGGRTLRYGDFRAFGQCFDEMTIHHFNLFSQIKTLIGRHAYGAGARMCLRGLRGVDQVILRVFPRMKRFCGKVVVEYARAAEGGAEPDG